MMKSESRPPRTEYEWVLLYQDPNAFLCHHEALPSPLRSDPGVAQNNIQIWKNNQI